MNENVSLPSSKNPISSEMSVVVNRLHAAYYFCKPLANQHTEFLDTNRTEIMDFMKKTITIGGDRTSKQVISRIVQCPHIVEALFVTRLGLCPASTVPGDARFYTDGCDYKMWWENPIRLVNVLYLLRNLNIGPVSPSSLNDLFQVLLSFEPGSSSCYTCQCANYQACKG